MLSRLCAGWLVLLILLPFSAPFSTCDLTMILGDQHGAAPASAATKMLVSQTTHALPHTRSAHRDQWIASNVEASFATRLRPEPRSRRGVTPASIVSSPILQPLRI